MAEKIRHAAQALGKRSARFRRFYRSVADAKRSAQWARHLRDNAVEDKTVFFESYMGRSYSDSPRALYRAMLDDPAYDDFTFIWAFAEPSRYAEHPDFARASLVTYHGRDFYAALARARYWITNSVLPAHLKPRDEQVLVQTWHGTPLKRLGCDIDESASANAMFSATDIHDRYRNEGSRLTWLLSPSAFTTEKFTSAFDLEALGKTGAIIEEGYPRNDFLATHTAADVARIKSELGIPQGKRVVLYAPTWRDNQHTVGVGYTLKLGVDFDELRSVLGNDYVVLFRPHYFIASVFDFERHAGFVYDASDVDEISELYVVSDVLVTDYSSVFFDYANLRRPLIFHMYDLEDYTDDIRGFYLDLAELPGPIVKTTAELGRAILGSATRDEATLERYERFVSRFAPLDDGHASQRVLARVIGHPDGRREPASQGSDDSAPA